jgi:hypothetical protein
MDDQAKQAFTGASDWAKQIMTLSTGIVTLTVTLSDSIFGNLSGGSRWLLFVAWALYLVSIFCGIWVLTRLNDTLCDEPSVVASDVRKAHPQAFLQVSAFVAATGVIVIFGFITAG